MSRTRCCDALATEPKVCPHLHVPMQSGDDDVLRAMGRHYSSRPSTWSTSPRARRRERAGQINVTTDVIVGFPTEDEAAFERTLEAVDAAGITRVHVFPYSPAARNRRGRARRPRRPGREEAPLPGAARPLGAALPAAPRGPAGHSRSGC